MGRAYTIGVAASAGTGSFLFGYGSGAMTDVIASPNFREFFNTTKTSSIIRAINSTFSGGAGAGALMARLTIGWLGRKNTIQISAFLSLAGAVLQCVAQDLAMILVGRIVAGWAVRVMSMSAPLYQADCAHPKMCGSTRSLGLSQQMIEVGLIVSTWTTSSFLPTYLPIEGHELS